MYSTHTVYYIVHILNTVHIHYTVQTIYCILYSVLCTVQCTVYSVHWTVYCTVYIYCIVSIYCILYSVQCTVQCTVYSVLYSVQCTVYSVLYTVQCSVQFTVYCTVYSVLYIVHFTYWILYSSHTIYCTANTVHIPYTAEGEIPCKHAIIALEKVLAYPEIFLVFFGIFILHNYYITKRPITFYPGIYRRF